MPRRSLTKTGRAVTGLVARNDPTEANGKALDFSPIKLLPFAPPSVFAKAQNSANDLVWVGEPSKMDSLDYPEIKLLNSRMEIRILNRSTQRGAN